MISSSIRRILAASALAVCGAVTGPVAFAQQSYRFDLPQQSLADALRAIGRETNLNILFEPESVRNLTAGPLQGVFTATQAIDHVLIGTKLVETQTDASSVLVRPSALAKSTPQPAGVRPTPSLAADPPSDPVVKQRGSSGKSDALEEVVVQGRYIASGVESATKISAAARDVPFATVSYSEHFLKSIQATNVTDIYKYMTGISSAGESGYNVQFRGFTASDSDFNTVLVNGLPGLPVRFIPPPTFGLDHVEIVKGPASIYYGQMQPGGFINLITKKPQSRQHGEFQVTETAEQRHGGQAWGTDAAFDLTGPAGTDKRVLYRIVGEMGDIDHFRRNSFERPKYLAPSLTWNISPDTIATLELTYQEMESSYDRYDASDLVAPNLDITKVAPIYTTYNQPTDIIKEEGKVVALSLVHYFDSGVSWNSSYRYVYHIDDTRGFDVAGIRSNLETLQRRPRQQHDERIYNFGDTYLSIPFVTGPVGHKAVVGVQYGQYISDFDRQQFYNAPPPPSPYTADIDIYNPNYGTALQLSQYPSGSLFDTNTKDTQSGVYASDLMSLSSHWKATIGGRYARVTQLSYYKFPAGNPVNDVHSTKWLPQAGLVYQPNHQLAFYASYSTSYVPPPPSAVDVNGQHGFAPQFAKGFELGTKDYLWGERIYWTADVYKITETNLLYTFTCPQYGSCSTPVGQEESKGAEVEINAQPVKGWQVLTGYNYTLATISKSLTASQVGARLQNVPLNSAHLWSRYDIQSGRLQNLGFGAGVSYESARTGTLPTAPSSKVLILPGYTLADLALYYSIPGSHDRTYNLTLEVSNVLNKVYYPAAGGGGALAIVPGTPRLYTLTFDTQF